jgi:MYXO-CTERM domain-containing protein
VESTKLLLLATLGALWIPTVVVGQVDFGTHCSEHDRVPWCFTTTAFDYSRVPGEGGDHDTYQFSLSGVWSSPLFEGGSTFRWGFLLIPFVPGSTDPLWSFGSVGGGGFPFRPYEETTARAYLDAKAGFVPSSEFLELEWSATGPDGVTVFDQCGVGFWASSPCEMIVTTPAPASWGLLAFGLLGLAALGAIPSAKRRSQVNRPGTFNTSEARDCG